MSEPVPAAIRPYTQLTRTPEIDQIQQRAEQIVGDAQATNPYTKAKALRDYFRGSGFVYDTSVDSFDSGSAILQFLHDKRGFCVQFASAYAVMARTLGIPARVAVGFTPGTLGRERDVPRLEPRRARVARDLPERCWAGRTCSTPRRHDRAWRPRRVAVICPTTPTSPPR